MREEWGSCIVPLPWPNTVLFQFQYSCPYHVYCAIHIWLPNSWYISRSIDISAVRYGNVYEIEVYQCCKIFPGMNWFFVVQPVDTDLASTENMGPPPDPSKDAPVCHFVMHILINLKWLVLWQAFCQFTSLIMEDEELKSKVGSKIWYRIMILIFKGVIGKWRF